MPGASCLLRNDHLIVLFYVDDIIVAYHEGDYSIVKKFEENLSKKYDTKPPGQIEHFLGIRVVKDELNRRIWLIQGGYIDTILSDFNIDTENIKIPSTPLPT